MSAIAMPHSVPLLTVDPAKIRTCGGQLLAASSQIDDTGTYVAGNARVPQWQGDSATTYHSAIAPIGRRADAMSLALRGVAQRVEVHADEMEQLQSRRDDLLERRSSLSMQVSTLRSREGQPMTPEDRATFEEDVRVVRGDVSAFDTDVATWTTDISTEEQEMIAAFDRVRILDQVDEHYGDAVDPADAALGSKPPAGASPEEVREWWDSLTPAQQAAIIAAAPGAIGNLDGIPASARDEANRNALNRDIADLENTEDEGVITDDERDRLNNARDAQEAIDNIEGTVDPVTGEPIQASVYIYDPGAFDGDGRTAIAAGDPDTADNVAITVPGLGTDAGSAPTMADRVTRMYEAARVDDPSATNATMFWIGYDAPDNLPWPGEGGLDAAGVVREDMARAGGERLADTIDGLRASRPGEAAHLTVIGHSYGSTTMGIGAHEHGLDVDDMIALGSPGLGGDTNHARDLNMDPDHVWAGANSRDAVTNLANHGAFHLELFGGGGLGDDPVEDDFGANRIQAESTTRGDGDNFDDHSKYFDHDTESLHNITQVVNGHYDDVQHADHKYDPWLGGPQDPEDDRTPTAPDTDGRP